MGSLRRYALAGIAQIEAQCQRGGTKVFTLAAAQGQFQTIGKCDFFCGCRHVRIVLRPMPLGVNRSG